MPAEHPKIGVMQLFPSIPRSLLRHDHVAAGAARRL